MADAAAVPRALALDWCSAPVSEADRAMLGYAEKLTISPHRMERSDVEALHEAGFDDTAVLDICQVVSYFNFVNRMADGLGVELEDYWTPDRLTLTREEFESRGRAR